MGDGLGFKPLRRSGGGRVGAPGPACPRFRQRKLTPLPPTHTHTDARHPFRFRSYKLPLCLMYRPRHVALACIWTVLKVLRVDARRRQGPGAMPWWASDGLTPNLLQGTWQWAGLDAACRRVGPLSGLACRARGMRGGHAALAPGSSPAMPRAMCMPGQGPLSPNPTNPFLALRALPTLSPRAEISTLLLDGMYAFESAEAAGTGDDAAPRGSQGAVAGAGVVEEYDELLMELDG